jgi:hypothetical protein
MSLDPAKCATLGINGDLLGILFWRVISHDIWRSEYGYLYKLPWLVKLMDVVLVEFWLLRSAVQTL